MPSSTRCSTRAPTARWPASTTLINIADQHRATFRAAASTVTSTSGPHGVHMPVHKVDTRDCRLTLYRRLTLVSDGPTLGQPRLRSHRRGAWRSPIRCDQLGDRRWVSYPSTSRTTGRTDEGQRECSAPRVAPRTHQAVTSARTAAPSCPQACIRRRRRDPHHLDVRCAARDRQRRRSRPKRTRAPSTHSRRARRCSSSSAGPTPAADSCSTRT